MRVRATARGYYGNQIREVGKVFDVPEGTKGSWFVPVESSDRGPRAPKASGTKITGGSAGGADDGGDDLA